MQNQGYAEMMIANKRGTLDKEMNDCNLEALKYLKGLVLRIAPENLCISCKHSMILQGKVGCPLQEQTGVKPRTILTSLTDIKYECENFAK